MLSLKWNSIVNIMGFIPEEPNRNPGRQQLSRTVIEVVKKLCQWKVILLCSCISAMALACMLSSITVSIWDAIQFQPEGEYILMCFSLLLFCVHLSILRTVNTTYLAMASLLSYLNTCYVFMAMVAIGHLNFTEYMIWGIVLQPATFGYAYIFLSKIAHNNISTKVCGGLILYALSLFYFFSEAESSILLLLEFHYIKIILKIVRISYLSKLSTCIMKTMMNICGIFMATYFFNYTAFSFAKLSLYIFLSMDIFKATGSLLKSVDLLYQCKSILNSVSSNQIISKNESCAICMDKMCKAYMLKCGHIFHGECILNMVTNRILKCPLCGIPIPVKVPLSVISIFINKLHYMFTPRSRALMSEAVITRVSEVFPRVPRNVIINELRRAGSMEAAINNLQNMELM